ncbi:MAG: PucR family transcriptional regulator [Anaerolineales bacterium]
MSVPASSLLTLLQLTLPGKFSFLAVDEARAANLLIEWITLDLNAARPGEAWLVPGASLTPERVQAAAARDIAAVITIGLPPAPDTFQDASIPVACLSAEEDLQAIYRDLLTTLVNRGAYLIEKGKEIQAQLTQLSAEGAGLGGLVAAMAEISTQGVLVQDKRLDVLASHSPMRLASSWDSVLRLVTVPESLPESLRDRKEAGKQSELKHQLLPNGLARIIISINVGGMARGYLSIVDKAGEMTALSRVVAEQGAIACAVEMSRSKAVRETEKRLRGDLLSALIRGDLSPRDARLWTETYGLDLEQSHTCLRFCWDSSEPPSVRRLETLVNGEIAKQGITAIVNVLENQVICFCEVVPDKVRPEEAINLGRSVIDRGMLTYPESRPRCGVGTPAQSLDDWLNSFRQAGQALEMAQRLSENRPLFYPDLLVYRLLLQIENSPELKAFQEEILGPLLDHENGKELIRTLEVYFERNGNLKKTAHNLYIHRNTLIYRLERIHEITSLDLDNPETRLALQLTLHIHKMLGNSSR